MMGNIFRKRNSNSGGVASRSRSIPAKDGSSSGVRREEVKTTTSGSRLPSRSFSPSFSAHFHGSSSLSEISSPVSSSSKTSTAAAAIRTEKSNNLPGYETNKYNFIPDNFSSLDQVSSLAFFFLPALVAYIVYFCPANMKCW